VVAVATRDYILTSTDFGVGWTSQISSGQGPWTGVACSGDGTSIAAVTSYGYVAVSSDCGATWKQRKRSVGTADWTGIPMSSSNGSQFGVIDSVSRVLISSDSGMTFSTVLQGKEGATRLADERYSSSGQVY